MTILPDVLIPGLKVVFCGTAVGSRSLEKRAYYAHRSNKFWNVLYRIGLTSSQLEPKEFNRLLEFGIGLTDLAKYQSGSDRQISQKDYDVAGFHSKIESMGPRVLAFNGKKAAEVFYGTRSVSYGLQLATIDQTSVFVLPSTSGAATCSWDESFWTELAEFVE